MVDRSPHEASELTLARKAEVEQGLSQTFPQPTLLLMAGFAGVGKTTLACKLNEELKWKMLNKDDLKRQHLENGEEVDLAGIHAFNELCELIYQTAIMNGQSVIIDTSNEKPFVFDTVMKVLEQMEENNIQAHLKVILCIANRETRTWRLNKRGSEFTPYVQELPAIADDAALLDRFQHLFSTEPVLFARFKHLLNNPKRLQRFKYLSGHKVLIVNTNFSLQTYLRYVRREIKTTRFDKRAGPELLRWKFLAWLRERLSCWRLTVQFLVKRRSC